LDVEANLWVQRFLGKTGLFPADHPSAPNRVAAGWEDALCRGGLASKMLALLEDHAERDLCGLIIRAHRGLFRFETIAGRHLVHDVYSGASFLLVARDHIAREMMDDNLGGLCQARVVGAADGCAMLPGVVFHAAEATEHIEKVLDSAHELQLSTDEVCDALLRMDHTLRTMSRSRAAFAYRPIKK
jgi:hypothetical protein